MNKFYLFFSAFTLLLLSSCKPLTPIPPSLSAIIGEIENDVALKRKEETLFKEAFLNDEIAVNDQVRTSEDSRSRVDLSSGTIIRIAPNSLFTLEANHESEQGLLTRIKIEAGKVWVILNGGSLEVETPSGLAGVRGSYMSTGYDPESGSVRITCLEGHCAAENESGSVNFTAGEAADLPADGSTPEKGLMTAEEFQMWAEQVPEAAGLLPTPPTPTATPMPTAAIAPTSTPNFASCTVVSTFLYIRTCPDPGCEALGYVEKDTLLERASSEKDGWISIFFEGEMGWINEVFCE